VQRHLNFEKNIKSIFVIIRFKNDLKLFYDKHKYQITSRREFLFEVFTEVVAKQLQNYLS